MFEGILKCCLPSNMEALSQEVPSSHSHPDAAPGISCTPGVSIAQRPSFLSTWEAAVVVREKEGGGAETRQTGSQVHSLREVK